MKWAKRKMAATLMRSLGWRTNICGLDFVTLLLRFHYLDWFRLCPQGSTRGLLKVRRFLGWNFLLSFLAAGKDVECTEERRRLSIDGAEMRPLLLQEV
ncbi:hypothetical protein CDAR_540961 [Caerostris darwini]|uniref:Uncharacterized protein n=1 Tax=Caerostris darwini TaxID=1538125 RepID=A0AAV4VJ17_9ARAC|nr:hypothetical protein CDAR_540961 [Caerostris darwini]